MEQFDQKSQNKLLEQSVRIKFQNLEISVQERDKNLKTIVNNTNGAFNPGELSILMGPTGAGKTTLLNVLSRNTYKLQIKGEIIYSKKYKDTQLSYQEVTKCLQIVHQEDAFYEYMTPFEVLDFAIKLKNYQSSAHQILKKIQLQACAHNYIGGFTTKGISGGERKRLSIALALLSNPQILILDEPTTGLDSQTAEIIIKLIKKQAQKYHRTVIATLHQPSSELFKFFNSIMLLSQGYTIYFGPADNVIQYFQSNGFQCERDYNPSEFFLEILSQINSIQISQFAQYNENY